MTGVWVLEALALPRILDCEADKATGWLSGWEEDDWDMSVAGFVPRAERDALIPVIPPTPADAG